MIKILYTGCIGQKLFPAFSTLPISMEVVCGGRLDALDAYMDVGGRLRQEQVVERRVAFNGKVK